MRSFHRRADQPPPDGRRFEFRPVTNADDDAHSSSRPAPVKEVKRATVGQDNRDFVHEALQVHNDLRRKHGAEALRLNNDLSKLAQQWGKRSEIDVPFYKSLSVCVPRSESSCIDGSTCT